MRLTANKIKWFHAIRDQLMEDASDYYKIHNGTEPDRVTSIDILEDNTFEVVCTRYSSSRCCGDDETCLDIPYDLLYNINWAEDLKEQLFDEQMERLRLKAEREAAEKKANQEAKEKAELETYKRLKAKFAKKKVNV
jgi:hypothetical protein